MIGRQNNSGVVVDTLFTHPPKPFGERAKCANFRCHMVFIQAVIANVLLNVFLQAAFPQLHHPRPVRHFAVNEFKRTLLCIDVGNIGKLLK